MVQSAQKRKKRKKISVDPQLLRQKLKLKHLETKKAFSDTYPKANKYLVGKGLELGKVREHSAKIVGAGALTGSILLTQPTDADTLPSPQEIVEKLKEPGITQSIDQPQKLLVDNMNLALPKKTRPLTRNEEKFLEQLFENLIGVKTRASLEGEHLNTTYGLIGAEQHLYRYPGDTIAGHGDASIQRSGLAPGKGAWGYFAPSEEKLTQDLVETEKWYAVVQTLYLHDWNTRQPHLKNWYKHRKVLIVNTDNGNAVVAAIADSGPAAWTGKHFGGSPEVMHYLGGSRYKKGPVVIFFVDDPENKMPLGPVEYSKITLPGNVIAES